MAQVAAVEPDMKLMAVKDSDPDLIVINSDSDDESKPESRTSVGGCSCCVGICRGKVHRMRFGRQSTSRTLESLFKRSRLFVPKKSTINLFRVFPALNNINREFLALLGTEYTERSVYVFTKNYINTMKKLQEDNYGFPNKCRALSKSVSRTLLLIKRMSANVIEQMEFFMQQMCELLAIYMFLELRYASTDMEKKERVVERIINNILLHLETSDVSFILRIFAAIPFVGSEAFIFSQVFRRLVPITASGGIRELNDKLYVQYLIPFYHWIDAETLPENQKEVKALANAFMKPMETLKTNPRYAGHLATFEERENQTAYFLTHMVFFHPLRTASLLDGAAVYIDDPIDLRYDVDLLCEDYLGLELVDEETECVDGTVDLTVEEEHPWLIALARTAREREFMMKTLQNKLMPSVIELDDSSDDESSSVRPAIQSKWTEQSTRTPQRTSSIDDILNLLDDSSSRLMILEAKDSVSRTEDSGSIAAQRVSFEGIIEEGISNLQLFSSTALTSAGLSPTVTSTLTSSGVSSGASASAPCAGESASASEIVSADANAVASTSADPFAGTSATVLASSSATEVASTSATEVASTSATEVASTSATAVASTSADAFARTCASPVASMSTSPSSSLSTSSCVSIHSSTSEISIVEISESTNTSMTPSIIAWSTTTTTIDDTTQFSLEAEQSATSTLETSPEMTAETQSGKEAAAHSEVPEVSISSSEDARSDGECSMNKLADTPNEANTTADAVASTCASPIPITTADAVASTCASPIPSTTGDAVASTCASPIPNTTADAVASTCASPTPSTSMSASMTTSLSTSSVQCPVLGEGSCESVEMIASTNITTDTSMITTTTAASSSTPCANEIPSAQTNEDATQSMEIEPTPPSDLETTSANASDLETSVEATAETQPEEEALPRTTDACTDGEPPMVELAEAPKEAVTPNLDGNTNSLTCDVESNEVSMENQEQETILPNDEILTTPDSPKMNMSVNSDLPETPQTPETQMECEEASPIQNVEETVECTPLSSAQTVEEYAVVEENQAQPDAEEPSAPPAPPAPPATEPESALKGLTNVLFSRRVISLREDDCSTGRMSPSYLKVPESVEVSSKGSNVVFSMQGRRLSSFPPLQAESLNDHVMPDFDAEFFSECVNTPQSILKEKPAATPAPAVTTFPKTIIKSTEAENEKPTGKRRQVWFSDKNEVHEIAPRDEPDAFPLLSSLNSISASINTINASKQQFLPSTSHQHQHSPSTSTATSSSHPRPPTPPINSCKSPTSTHSAATPAINSILLKKSMPPPSTATSPDTASLKSAQEKDPHAYDDNRTDDVLAAAEILANGIRLVQTIAQPAPSFCCDGGVAVADAPPSPSLAPQALASLAPLDPLPSPSPSPPPPVLLLPPPPPPPPPPQPQPSSSSSLDEIEIELNGNRSEMQQLIEAASIERAQLQMAPMQPSGQMLASPTTSEGNDSLLEGFAPIRRQNIESVEDYDQFYRCNYSPSNMKRLLSDGHISLPLKKRRKLSEYGEETELVESYDNDTVLNLKMPRKEVQPEKPKQPPASTSKSFVRLEKDLKDISYPSEPMLSIAHFEKDGYRETSKDLSVQRPYPPVPPPRYSDVVRDCRPMTAHHQGFFPHPDQPALHQSNTNPTHPQGMPTRPTINIVTARHTDNFGTINIINQENGTINIVTEENRDVNANTTNVYSSSQPVTNVNVGYQNPNNMQPFQYSQPYLPKQQNCHYNVQPRPPPPAPTPEHIPSDFELLRLINVNHYQLNSRLLNNYLRNAQINFPANQTIMNDALCGSSYQPNAARSCTDSVQSEPSTSSAPKNCEGSATRRSSRVPKCGICMDCKRAVGLNIPSPNPITPAQFKEESSEVTSSPPKRRARLCKPVAEPTNRVTRSTNRTRKKRKEEPSIDQFHVSDTKSPSSAKKRRSASSRSK